MITFQPLDPKMPIQQQLGADAAPVILVNFFTVDPANVETLLVAWEHDANWMKRQPGYISTQLHRAIGGSSVFLNYAVWESTAHFKAAFTNPEFQNMLGQYPASATASPHLFRKVAVPGICVA